MDIALVSKNSVRIKTKRAALVINPSDIATKTEAEIAMLLDKDNEHSLCKIEGGRLVVSGAGEYEVEGVKISAFDLGTSIAYKIIVDNLEIILAKAEALKKMTEISKESQIIVLYSDTVIDQSLIVGFSPSVVVLYGEKAVEIAGILGGKELNSVSKYQITQEKLPVDLQIIVLK